MQPSAPSTPLFREETEGERKHILKEMDVIRRNPQLRQMCLDKYGYQCQCCGMDFEETYGRELGVNFMEVHHLRMISTYETDGVPKDFMENLMYFMQQLPQYDSSYQGFGTSVKGFA